MAISRPSSLQRKVGVRLRMLLGKRLRRKRQKLSAPCVHCLEGKQKSCSASSPRSSSKKCSRRMNSPRPRPPSKRSVGLPAARAQKEPAGAEGGQPVLTARGRDD
jgi:hypothetical protein